LDLAADYIAAQFRRAGLEPVGDDGYFQTATLTLREPDWDGFHMSVTAGGKTLEVSRSEVYPLPDAPLTLDGVPLVAVDSRTKLTPELVNGKVVLATEPRVLRPLQNYQPLIVFLDSRDLPANGQVRDPEAVRRGPGTSFIAKTGLAGLAKSGSARVTLHAGAALDHPVKVRNVAGLLRGSDPALRDTYVLLTAHYDHVGMRNSGEDRIYNGANDDGSGTVSVMELASALATVEPRPKRSILFMTFFGEERGLLGSHYYERHPLEPLAKTVADLNLEQLGRTDATNGSQIGTASLTGFDYTDIPRVVVDAGHLVGIKIYKDTAGSDAFFSRSDNQPLADAGIPAHTLCVAFDYPDYHGVGDEWNKIDYANMAKVDRAIALALLHLASDAAPPQWNDTYPAARKYLDASKKLHNE
jgi:hypothetical protein